MLHAVLEAALMVQLTENIADMSAASKLTMKPVLLCIIGFASLTTCELCGHAAGGAGGPQQGLGQDWAGAKGALAVRAARRSPQPRRTCFQASRHHSEHCRPPSHSESQRQFWVMHDTEYVLSGSMPCCDDTHQDHATARGPFAVEGCCGRTMMPSWLIACQSLMSRPGGIPC